MFLVLRQTVSANPIGTVRLVARFIVIDALAPPPKVDRNTFHGDLRYRDRRERPPDARTASRYVPGSDRASECSSPSVTQYGHVSLDADRISGEYLLRHRPRGFCRRDLLLERSSDTMREHEPGPSPAIATPFEDCLSWASTAAEGWPRTHGWKGPG
jgi:hypothetical protein